MHGETAYINSTPVEKLKRAVSHGTIDAGHVAAR
jgi:hypothetical protein